MRRASPRALRGSATQSWLGRSKVAVIFETNLSGNNRRHDLIGASTAADTEPATESQHMLHGEKMGTSDADVGPTITAVLERGPLAGRHTDVDVVEGRPPKTIDVSADDGSRCRYCLADWTQTGPSAIYTFLYLV